MFSTRRLLLAAILTASIVFAPACGNLPTEPNMQDDAGLEETWQTYRAQSAESNTTKPAATKAESRKAMLANENENDVIGRFGITRVY